MILLCEEAKRMKHFNIFFILHFLPLLFIIRSSLMLLFFILVATSLLELFYINSFARCFHLDDEFLVCYMERFVSGFVSSFIACLRYERSHANENGKKFIICASGLLRAATDEWKKTRKHVKGKKKSQSDSIKFN